MLVGIDVVNVMAEYQPVAQACGEHRLICRHDCVYTDEHRKTIFVVLAKHRTAP